MSEIFANIELRIETATDFSRGINVSLTTEEWIEHGLSDQTNQLFARLLEIATTRERSDSDA